MKYQLFFAVSLFPLSFFAKNPFKIEILTIIAKHIISVSVQLSFLVDIKIRGWLVLFTVGPIKQLNREIVHTTLTYSFLHSSF